MNNPIDLGGKVAIVTGGGRGVGRGISKQLAAAGAQLVICGRTKPESLPPADRGEIVFHHCDVRDPEQISNTVAFTLDRFGRIDILVNNAGGSPPAEAATASPRFSEAIIRLNLLAPLNFSQAVNAVMQNQDSGGTIINIASVSARRPSPGTAAYGAAKAGLVNLTGSLAVEWAPKVRVNAIVCGLTLTEQAQLHYGSEQGLAAVAATVPMGRLADPEDVGNTCVYLASALAGYVSGASLDLHGGGERPAFLAAAATEPS